MPEIADLITGAEKQGLGVVSSLSLPEEAQFELVEYIVGLKLVPQLEVLDRALLVALRVAQTFDHPDNPDNEEDLAGFMKDVSLIDHLRRQIEASGLMAKLDPTQKQILEKRFFQGAE